MTGSDSARRSGNKIKQTYIDRKSQMQIPMKPTLRMFKNLVKHRVMLMEMLKSDNFRFLTFAPRVTSIHQYQIYSTFKASPLGLLATPPRLFRGLPSIKRINSI
jgi:hypothetical protein